LCYRKPWAIRLCTPSPWGEKNLTHRVSLTIPYLLEPFVGIRDLPFQDASTWLLLLLLLLLFSPMQLPGLLLACAYVPSKNELALSMVDVESSRNFD
jgi:hypothetical protein